MDAKFENDCEKQAEQNAYSRRVHAASGNRAEGKDIEGEISHLLWSYRNKTLEVNRHLLHEAIIYGQELARTELFAEKPVDKAILASAMFWRIDDVHRHAAILRDFAHRLKGTP